MLIYSRVMHKTKYIKADPFILNTNVFVKKIEEHTIPCLLFGFGTWKKPSHLENKVSHTFYQAPSFITFFIDFFSFFLAHKSL